MKNLFLMYTLSRKKDGAMHVAMSNKIRLVYLALSTALLVVLWRVLGAWHPLLIAFMVVLPFTVIAEDRWIFDIPHGYLRRRFGLIMFAKTWHLPLEEIAGLEYSKDLAAAIDQADPLNRIYGTLGHKDAGLRIRLMDGRSLTLFAAAGKHFPLVKDQALTLAEAINRPATEV